MKMTSNSASLVVYWWCCISNYDKLLTKKKKKGKKIYALPPPPKKVYRRRSVSLLFLQLPIWRYYFGYLFFPFLVCVLVSLYGTYFGVWRKSTSPRVWSMNTKGDITNSLGPLKTLSPHLKIPQRNSNPRETKMVRETDVWILLS